MFLLLKKKLKYDYSCNGTYNHKTIKLPRLKDFLDNKMYYLKKKPWVVVTKRLMRLWESITC